MHAWTALVGLGADEEAQRLIGQREESVVGIVRKIIRFGLLPIAGTMEDFWGLDFIGEQSEVPPGGSHGFGPAFRDGNVPGIALFIIIRPHAQAQADLS